MGDKRPARATQRHTYAALVLDTSSSILEPTATGGTKLAAALDAARAFLAELHLDAGDQAAIVAFKEPAVIDRILRHLRSKHRDARAGPWATGPPGEAVSAEAA